MHILRTDDSHFAGLTDWPYPPHYTEIADTETGTPIRIHHVEAGDPAGPVVLLMHGNPTWCYLYRHMIPGLAAAGNRVIAVDLVGHGRSDKPASKDDYTLARHHQWIRSWIEALDLTGITLFCQDWGGTIGLAMVAFMPDRFARVVASNTGVPAGEGGNEALRSWLDMMGQATAFPWPVMAMLSEDKIAAYRLPYPDSSYEAGLCKFPTLIAIFPDNPGVPLNKRVLEELARFDKPFLTIWGALDIVAPGADKRLQALIPGAQGLPHQVLPNANHFTQEDAPEEMVAAILDLMQSS
jgi:haloalkane dehalogenase